MSALGMEIYCVNPKLTLRPLLMTWNDIRRAQAHLKQGRLTNARFTGDRAAIYASGGRNFALCGKVTFTFTTKQAASIACLRPLPIRCFLCTQPLISPSLPQTHIPQTSQLHAGARQMTNHNFCIFPQVGGRILSPTASYRAKSWLPMG